MRRPPTTEVLTRLLAGRPHFAMAVASHHATSCFVTHRTTRRSHPHGRVWAGHDIRLQFLIEDPSHLVFPTGGVLGKRAGHGGAKLLDAHQALPRMVSPRHVIIAFIFIAAVGIFFGFDPALKASTRPHRGVALRLTAMFGVKQRKSCPTHTSVV